MCQNAVSGHPEALQIPKSGERLHPFEPCLKSSRVNVLVPIGTAKNFGFLR